MAKKSPIKRKHSPSARAQLQPLTDIEQQVVSYVLNNVAFNNYRDCCSVEGMAEEFQRTPGRFNSTLRKLADKGYITIRGETLPWVYPTVAALRQQDKQLSEAAAKKIIAKIEK